MTYRTTTRFQSASPGERMKTMQADYRADINSALRQQLIAIVGIVALGFVGLGFFLSQQTPVPPAPPVIIQTTPAPVPAGDLP